MTTIIKDALPVELYSVEAVRQLDAITINEFSIPGYELMKRAGAAFFNYLQNSHPLARRILLCCGAGNNAGDGYVIAKLAMRAGLDVHVISLVDTAKLKGDARTAWQDWHSLGHQLSDYSATLVEQADVVVDALLGTGLQRDVEGAWAELINDINRCAKQVISVDIPSGLCGDTGRVQGVAVCASATVTFIGVKKGLLTHQGVDCCGELIFDDLGIPAQVYERQQAQATRLNWPELCRHIKPRKASSHKHKHGHLLVLGGDKGMPGAARLAAESALRAGAGLVTVVSHGQHSEILLAGCPEIMIHPCEDGCVSEELFTSANAVVVGPGLGVSAWSQNILAAALSFDLPMVIDAGALRLMSEAGNDAIKSGVELNRRGLKAQNRVLTPHAGEAAALLGETAECIQASRFASAELLQQQYGGHVVLKGAGSLLQSPGQLVQLCPYGNPGLAVAGTGDVLSGIIGALLAQGYETSRACQLGVCIHSLAGDIAAEQGQIGLLASDLYTGIRKVMNAHCKL